MQRNGLRPWLESCRAAYCHHSYSSYFFEVVLARALGDLNIGVMINGFRLYNLHFADDIAVPLVSPKFPRVHLGAGGLRKAKVLG